MRHYEKAMTFAQEHIRKWSPLVLDPGPQLDLEGIATPPVLELYSTFYFISRLQDHF